MNIKTVTVVGANGTMGSNISAIFAAFGNAKVYMISRDLEKSEKALEKAVKSVRAGSIYSNLVAADYSALSECIEKSDIVFESVAENIDIKIDIMNKIAKSIRSDAIVCSGTSGLSITNLSECLPENMRGRYFGVHMFNPPYNMPLCELVTTKYTDFNLLKSLKSYLENTLLRTVVEIKDKPAFLANRIGFQFINSAMQCAETYKENGGIDYVDAIIGSFTGRAMSPLVTADFVGLDVHKAIVDNVYNNTNDYAHDDFVLPPFAQELINAGKLGRKSGEGLYKSKRNSNGGKSIEVYDINTGEYREKINYVFPFAEEMKKNIKVGNYTRAFDTLINNHSIEAEICLQFLLNYIVYSLVTAENVAYDINAADAAMATGFNWCPPMAMIDAFSTVTDISVLIKDRLPADLLAQVDVDILLSKISQSKYDYRPYFKSL